MLNVAIAQEEELLTPSVNYTPRDLIVNDEPAIQTKTFSERGIPTEEELADLQKKIDGECQWIKLNTDFPIIWNCIKIKKWNGKDEEVDPTNAFSYMMGALSQIVVSLVLVICFILIIVAGIMRAWAWDDTGKTKAAKDILQKVAITIVLLWLAWVILKAINPVFFS